MSGLTHKDYVEDLIKERDALRAQVQELRAALDRVALAIDAGIVRVPANIGMIISDALAKVSP